MKSPLKYRLAITCMVTLLLSLNICYAKEADKSKDGAGPALHSDTRQSGGVVEEELPSSPRFDQQERYNRLHKEYVESINKAESDEERVRLQREFDEETREYRNSLAEQEDGQERDIEKEKQALKDEYQMQLRQLEQDYDKNVRRLKEECRRDAFGVELNRPDLEPAECKKLSSLENEFRRRSISLENDYKASLRELQY